MATAAASRATLLRRTAGVGRPSNELRSAPSPYGWARQSSGRRSLTVCADKRRVRPQDVKGYKKVKQKRILALDGGGCRGILSATILVTLEKLIKEKICALDSTFTSPEEFDILLADWFDCISGTSIGAAIALYLASKGQAKGADILEQPVLKRKNLVPGTAEAMQQLFLENAQTIFYRPPFYYKNAIVKKVWDLIILVKSVFKPKYGAGGIEKVLKQCLGPKSLMRDNLDTSVLITSFELSGNSSVISDEPLESGVPLSFFYHHHHSDGSSRGTDGLVVRASTETADSKKSGRVTNNIGSDADEDVPPLHAKILVPPEDFRLWEVARASSAAPTYFPAGNVNTVGQTHGLPSYSGFLADGGLVSNNPTVQAMAFVSAANRVHNELLAVSDVAVLSVGTGIAAPNYDKSTYTGGLISWARRMPDLAITGSAEMSYTLALQMIDTSVKDVKLQQYTRIQKYALFPGQQTELHGNGTTTPDEEDYQLLQHMDEPGDCQKLIAMGEKLMKTGSTEYNQMQRWVDDYLFSWPSEGEPSTNGSLGEGRVSATAAA